MDDLPENALGAYASVRAARRLSRVLEWKPKAATLKEIECEICGKAESKNGKRLAQDHCHETMRNRGRLCSNCNTGLGMFQDNPDLLLAAVRYLVRFGKKIA